MSNYQHQLGRSPCSFLPEAKKVLKPSDLKELRKGDDREKYYIEAQRCAQSLWLCGLPAQSLLQLNLALGEDFSEGHEVLEQWALPYRAKLWIFKNTREEDFLGNPVRHYQHLASRMKQSPALRVLRAWACFHLAEQFFPAESFPRDEAQIEKESLMIPSLDSVLSQLRSSGYEKEASLIFELYEREASSY